MSEKRFTYFKVPLGFGKQAIKDNVNYGVFDFTLSNVLDKLNEQQDTISQLQDICGESDGENAKLRIENKRLQAENEQLMEILHNCKFNKNIMREQLKLWQDTLAEYDIYTIKDLSESFELDTKIRKEKDDL